MAEYETKLHETMLDLAQDYADEFSTCTKVKVGSVIVIRDAFRQEMRSILGCNHGVNECSKNGCRRIKLYGEASKSHRLPSDCDAIHSEVDAICKASKLGYCLEGSVIWVTRYPCEACARAIAAAGIKKVVYGREEEVSEYTKQILEGVELIHQSDWEREDNNE